MSSHVLLAPPRPAAQTAAALGGALLAATLLALPSSSLAQVSGLRGVVVDPGGEPVEGAALALDGRPISVQTADDGSFSLPRVDAGEHDLRVDRLGFTASSLTVQRNLTDEVYSPTFSVDDAAGRYFQPADGRSLYAGVRWHR